MRHVTYPLILFAVLGLTACLGNAQPNPVTNGGFEMLTPEGTLVDWEPLGPVKIVPEAHSGRNAVLLERSSSTTGECGLNRTWKPDSGLQGTMLSQLQGGFRFWYKAEAASDPKGLEFNAIAMNDRPMEGTGEQRATYRVPASHVGDGKWHEGLLTYNFSRNPKVKWIQVSPRVRGDRARLLLDDVTWVEKVGPLPAIYKVRFEEVKGKEGHEGIVTATLRNAGDSPLDLGTATISLPPGLTCEGGFLRGLRGLAPEDYAEVYWRVLGRRETKGRFDVTFQVGDQQITDGVAYGPALEIAGFAPREFVLPVGKRTECVLKLRNSGQVVLRGLSAELRPVTPLTTTPELRKQGIGDLGPGAEAQVIWEVSADRQTPEVALRAVVTCANGDGGRAESRLVIGPKTNLGVATPPGCGVLVGSNLSALYNDQIRLLLPRADFGWGIGVLQRREGKVWETVGKLPRLSRVAAFNSAGDPEELLVYASSVKEVAGAQPEEKRLELQAVAKDAAGVSWTITETLSLRPGEEAVRFQVRGVPDRDAKLLALDGPLFYAGEGAPVGTRRLDAIFPGLEWLVEGEESSSTLDIAADHPHRVRYVPHPHMVTIPLMCARLQPPSGTGVVASLSWDLLRAYYPGHNRPSAVFSSPDRFGGHAGTLMGIFAPSMPEYIEPNERTAKTPLEVTGGSAVDLQATLRVQNASAGETSLVALKSYLRDNPPPEPNPLPHGQSLTDEIDFSMAGYLSSLWVADEEKWRATIGGPASATQTVWSPAYLHDLRMCLDTTKNQALKQEVQDRYDRVVALSGLTPVAGDEGYDFSGPAGGLLGRAGSVAGLVARQLPDGSWRFRTRIEREGTFKGRDYSELGPNGAAEIGTCARTAWELLRFAHTTGDSQALAAGLKALAFMDQFEVPRAAQVWEVPVHTPDILASSDACEAYLEAYEITGKKPYLDKAVYWAWTGLPFLYLWDTPGFEYLRYASIPVFGATWFKGSWFGRPVQWNGLRYAYAVAQLAEYDSSLDWKRIARGITVSGMYQQSEEDKDRALWPDSISAIDQKKSGWIFAPRQILQNVYWMMGMQPTPVTTIVTRGLDEMRITAAGKVSDAVLGEGQLSFKVTYEPPQRGYVVICGTSKPASVTLDGKPVPEVSVPSKSDAPGWRHTEDTLLELRVGQSGTHAVQLVGVRAVPSSLMPKVAKQLTFNFDSGTEGWRPSHDLAPFSVSDGVLQTTTTASDPYMVRTSCEVPASTVKQIRLRMSLTAGLNADAQFFWTTADSLSLDEPKSMRFRTIPDGQFHEYVIPVGESRLWQGTITSVRLDPTGGTPLGEVKIDFLRGE